jgi:hypothetical protein
VKRWYRRLSRMERENVVLDLALTGFVALAVTVSVI